MSATAAMAIEDREAIRELATGFFAARAPLETQMRLARAGAALPRDLLVEMAELDFFAQSAPEDAGGLGLSPLASGIVVEAAGRQLVPGPLIDQLVATRMAADDPELLRLLASGERLAAVAFAGGGGFDQAAGTVSGSIAGLRFGRETDWWVLAVPGAVVILDPHGAGVADVVDEPAVDPLWRSVSVTLSGAPAVAALVRSESDADEDLAYACGLVASHSVGAARRLLEDTIAYVKDREQFGRPVGAFQAVKHRAANSHIAILHTHSLVESALQRTEGAAHLLRVARVAADRCYRLTTENALQMHGGIGFTAESPVHLFLKNAQQLRRWPVPVSADLAHVRAALALDEPPEEEGP